MNRDESCIFCKIIDGKIPANVVSQDDSYIAIRDVNPQAPTHILVIPKNHLRNITEVRDGNVLGELFLKVTAVAKSENLIGDGFRTVVNTGGHGGQTVDHLHIHIFGGRPMQWPPG